MNKRHRHADKETVASSNAPSESVPASTPQNGCTLPESEQPLDPGVKDPSVPSDLSALTDRLLRLQADFDNYRKRVQRDQADTARRSLETVMEDLLPVLDHFELGMCNAESLNLPEGLLAGFRMVYEQLQSVLGRHGLAPMEKEEKLFNPKWHESIAVEPSNQPPDTILRQTRCGYRLGGQLLRPAQVILAGLKEEPESSAEIESKSEV